MKTFQRIPFTTLGKLVLGLLMTILAYGAAANAEPAFSGKFVLPQEVRWNHAVLPAGEYTIEMSSIAAPAVLHSKKTSKAFYTAQPMVSESRKGGTEINITVQGNERTVRSLNLPGIGHALIFAPLTKAEIETLARAGETEVVPLITARK
jgi:hypothetical protein